ncbi:SLATT domain-containing protein [Rhodobacter capsulatus]|jgi:hypothetical protein|uniref:Membrane protein, putative n=1 Tax=Rhodobacter capsulatus (strain ATCC BAA-309 / NBRC 16581 / SB1003) TaxID=272942 RepID=D5ASC9_RHOCB|nr:membrane protein, putative [Rhodobacter capsulatus SB 1003]
MRGRLSDFYAPHAQSYWRLKVTNVSGINSPTPDKSLADKIWLTSHCRMNAERRNRRYEIWATIELSSVSVGIIGLTTFRDRLGAFPVDEYTLILSIMTLVISTLIAGAKFGERAATFRECYLQLERLNASKQDLQEKTSEYNAILASYPNHSDIDYTSLIISRTLWRNQELCDPRGRSITWTWGTLGSWILYIFVEVLVYLVLPALVFLPAAVLAW